MLPIGTRYAFDLTLAFSPPESFGPTPFRESRSFSMVTGGTISGEKIKGKILPGTGGEWPHVYETGHGFIEGQFLVLTDDGTKLLLKIDGYWNEPVAAGSESQPCRVAPFFEAPSGPYEWLTRTIFLGKGERSAKGARYGIYEVT